MNSRLRHEFLVGPLPEQPRAHLLGAVAISANATQLDAGRIPQQALLAPLLLPQVAQGVELWLSEAECRYGVAEGIRYAHDGNLLFGSIEVDESAFSPRQELDDLFTPLRQAANDAYRRIFALLDTLNYPSLWRAWNYLADINGVSFGLERYRQFNIGRYESFCASGRLATGKVPAASALGVVRGPLSVAFIAARGEARAIENPRQMPAYDYPVDYGPRSPTFARAALAKLPRQELLFVSGTASIVGHATVHEGDVAAQARESLANIAAVIAEADRYAPQALVSWHPQQFFYRVYVRNGSDLDLVRQQLETSLGAQTEMVFVQADICRSNLLVEIEAFATRALADSNLMERK